MPRSRCRRSDRTCPRCGGLSATRAPRARRRYTGLLSRRRKATVPGMPLVSLAKDIGRAVNLTSRYAGRSLLGSVGQLTDSNREEFRSLAGVRKSSAPEFGGRRRWSLKIKFCATRGNAYLLCATVGTRISRAALIGGHEDRNGRWRPDLLVQKRARPRRRMSGSGRTRRSSCQAGSAALSQSSPYRML